MPAMSSAVSAPVERNPRNARVLERDHDEPYDPDTRRDDVPTDALVRAFVVILIMLIFIGGGAALSLWCLQAALFFVMDKL
jgi:hypothetical protein